MDRDRLTQLLAFALVIGALVIPDVVGPGGGALPSDPQVLPPSAEMRRIVQPILELSPPADVAVVASSFFAAAADVVDRDSGTINTTGQVRSWMADASKLRLQGTDYGSQMPGFDAAANKAVMDAIGSENVSLDAAKRKRLVEVLRGIAWAIQN